MALLVPIFVAKNALSPHLQPTSRRLGEVGARLHTVWVVTDGLRTRRNSGYHFTPQFRQTACYR